MKYKRILFGLFLLGCIAAVTGFADDPIERIISGLSEWAATHPQEKVYLQLDKPYYTAGDNIWFKAYLTAGSEHKLSAISGVLNVELINDRDEVAMSEKLPVINGLSWGDFALPDSLAEGNYRIRAYTNWMRNAGEPYFFDRNITVIAPAGASIITKTNYSYSQKNGRPQVDAVIGYTAADGTPYAGKPVSYAVALGANTFVKGKGTTDDKGNLFVSFQAPENMGSPAVVTTAIKLDAKKTVDKSVVIKAFSAKADIQFFPEGGNLVIGNRSKIAFKAIGTDGLGVHVKGIIVDEQGKQVAAFSDLHDGMGIFELTPASGRTYKAEVTYADGSQNAVALPLAVNDGYTLSVDDNGPAKIEVRIMPGATISTAAQTGTLSLVAQAGGVVYYAGKSQPGMKSFTAEVPKSKFPTGIMQFTLFSANGEPLNERLVFVQNNDQLKLNATAGRQSYQPGERATIDLQAADKDGKPVVGSFSVAVTDESKAPFDENNSESILSNLLLTSDLKGYIENPGYYFSNENQQTAAALDALLLTQGYRRFEWKQILNKTYPPVAYQPEKSLEISGHLKNLLGRPVANGRVMLFSTQGGVFMIDTVSDKNGRFVFKNLVFKDSVKFLVQARTAKDHKNVTIDVDNIAPPKPGAGNNAAGWQADVSDVNPAFLKASRQFQNEKIQYELASGNIQLKEVQVKAAKINPAENSSNLNGPGNADQVVGADVIAKLSCPQLGDCLQGLLAGVRFQNNIPYLADGTHGRMTIFIDGIQADTDLFNSLNPNDVASIEVLRSIAYTSIYGGRGGNGVLIITTKHGDGGYGVQRYAPGILTYSPQGYYKARVFYTQPAGNTAAKNTPSDGTTVYWNPNIVTGNDGKASIQYDNPSAKGVYKVIIEGIDSDGKLGSAVLKYNVE